MIYFISEAKIKEMINDNVESELIRTSITTIQMVNLKTIIGDSLYETIEKLIENNVVVDPYKTLLDGYIIPYMQYAVLAELVIPSTYKIGNIGVNQAYTESVNTTTMSDCKYLKQYYTDRSAFMEQRLTDYLNKNRSIFTDYDNYQDITTSRSTSMQSGLFLGGRTKSNNVSNEKTLLHDSTIRAYIRYDEPQNLTPEAQAQAKRNIGIENINFDDIYTKEETDTLISNINTFSGDYNDLENKPDVYTKSQTDTAIQNAVDGIETFSGNYNDLTNKPELFDGNYNSLSNKPTIPTDTAQLTKSDIYTKAETFTRQEIVDMINEINYSDINNTPTLSTVATSGNYSDLNNLPTLFDGNYNSLTNTPTIPTATSQLQLDNVYNKSEIDLQFESVNTTLGNINNILETI